MNEIFMLIAKLDGKGREAVKQLWDEAQRIDRSVSYGIFASSYVGFSSRLSAMTMVISGLHSAFSDFYKKESVPIQVIEHVLEKDSLTHGQFYFLLVLLRWDDKLRLFYPYVINALKNNWRGIPYHLCNEILDNISHFPEDEQQRTDLIDALNTIHSETNDPWKSTMIFDALSSLGALEDDATAYIPIARYELERLFENPDLEESWGLASSMYDRQFDHPYDYAYQVAIDELDEAKTKVFYEMALKGTDRSFFGTSLLIGSTVHLGEMVCPLIEKWMENPIFEKTTPQDSLRIFLLSHIICAKYNYPILSRFSAAADPLNKSLFATAEIYYFINRADLNQGEKKELAEPALRVLFDTDNQYVIDSICESMHNVVSHDSKRLWENSPLNHIEHFFPEACLNASRSAIERLDWQQEVLGFNRGGSAVDGHAISILKRLGGILDIDLLRGLTEDPLLGKPAVETIKELSQKAS